MAETYTLYKLIVLYMLDKVDFPLTTSQISEFILEKEYTTYFKLQETLAEMEHSGLLRVETTHNRTLYHLTRQRSGHHLILSRIRFPLPFSGILMNFSKKRSMILKE